MSSSSNLRLISVTDRDHGLTYWVNVEHIVSWSQSGPGYPMTLHLVNGQHLEMRHKEAEAFFARLQTLVGIDLPVGEDA